MLFNHPGYPVSGAADIQAYSLAFCDRENSQRTLQEVVRKDLHKM